jgi:hypothetical protein
MWKQSVASPIYPSTRDITVQRIQCVAMTTPFPAYLHFTRAALRSTRLQTWWRAYSMPTPIIPLLQEVLWDMCSNASVHMISSPGRGCHFHSGKEISCRMYWETHAIFQALLLWNMKTLTATSFQRNNFNLTFRYKIAGASITVFFGR